MEPQPKLHAICTNAQLNRSLQIKITKYSRKITGRGNQKNNKVTKNQIPNYCTDSGYQQKRRQVI